MPNDEVHLLRRRLEDTTKELENATTSKKMFKWLALGLLLLLILILATIYKVMVLDYAQIGDVKIEQQENTRRVIFIFDVKSPGKLDYHYGKAIMVEKRDAGPHEFFGHGEKMKRARCPSEVEVRSFPNGTKRYLSFRT
jgi:hypothetical protein